MLSVCTDTEEDDFVGNMRVAMGRLCRGLTRNARQPS
jgi:hypothetical protein